MELLETKFPTYFIKSAEEIKSKDELFSFNIHSRELEHKTNIFPEKEPLKIAITSGASCPDAVVDQVLQKIAALYGLEFDPE